MVAGHALAKRAIPDDNLAYPVMVSVKLKNGLVGFGSGFYLHVSDTIYLVTAKHVIFLMPDDQLPDAELELMSYSKDPSDTIPIVVTVSLSQLNADGNVRAHEQRDVVVMKLGTRTLPDKTSLSGPAAPPPSLDAVHSWSPVSGLRIVSGTSGATAVSFSMEAVRTYDQVLVGNEAIAYGYPRSLGGPSADKEFDLDPLRPLLRKGLIAGLNRKKRTIILDCPVYRGNSRGPAVEAEPDDFNTKWLLIGVVTEFVPLTEGRAPGSEDFSVTFNSGYSIVEPMDFVLELVR